MIVATCTSINQYKSSGSDQFTLDKMGREWIDVSKGSHRDRTDDLARAANSGSGFWAEPDNELLTRLQSEVTKTLNASESQRSRLLLENVGGGAVGFLVGIDPPEPVGIDRMRKFVSGIQNEAKRLDRLEREEFDEWLGEIIDEYDPFGKSGKKVAFIVIPEDPGGRTSATVYSVEDFDHEIRRYKGLESSSFQMSAPRVYVTGPGEDLDRFEELIKTTE
jgi:hypothetical protein